MHDFLVINAVTIYFLFSGLWNNQNDTVGDSVLSEIYTSGPVLEIQNMDDTESLVDFEFITKNQTSNDIFVEGVDVSSAESTENVCRTQVTDNNITIEYSAEVLDSTGEKENKSFSDQIAWPRTPKRKGKMKKSLNMPFVGTADNYLNILQKKTDKKEFDQDKKNKLAEIRNEKKGLTELMKNERDKVKKQKFKTEISLLREKELKLQKSTFES